MASLGNTVATLAKRRRAAEGPAANGPAAMTLTRGFGANPGALEMLSYRPTTLGSHAALVVTLHGCTQAAEAYAADAGWLTLADRMGFAVLAPQQTMANNMNRCFNWFSPQDVSRGAGEVASIASMIAFMIRTHDLDPARVFVTGLSAGGAMTLAMLATYPELFAGGAVIAGLPYGVAHDMIQAMTAMRQADGRSDLSLSKLLPRHAGAYPRLTVWHGDADHVVSPGNAEAIVAQWALAQGLSRAPSETAATGTRTRSVWRRQDGGEVAIELNRLRGLGHGVPLSTLGDQGLGQTAPYMIEAGVSASTEIAGFWGLAPAGASDHASRKEPDMPTPRPRAARAEPADRDTAPPQRGGGVGDRVLALLSQHVPADVQEVVAKALRSAGLVK